MEVEAAERGVEPALRQPCARSEGVLAGAESQSHAERGLFAGSRRARIRHCLFPFGQTLCHDFAAVVQQSHGFQSGFTSAATYGRDGRLAFLYREETDNERDIYAVLWDQSRDAKPTRTRISTTSWKVNACPMTYFAITPTDTGYVAAWPTKGQIFFARLDKDGAVLSPGEIRTPGTSGMRTGVVALTAGDGETLIAWKNKDALGWQLYDAKGQPQGPCGSEPSQGTGATGVVLPDGRFLLFP